MMTAFCAYLLASLLAPIVLTAAGLLWQRWLARREEERRMPWRRLLRRRCADTKYRANNDGSND